MSREADRERLAALVAATARKAEVKALLTETKAAWETASAARAERIQLLIQ